MKTPRFIPLVFALLTTMSFAAEKSPMRVAFVFDDGPVVEQTVKMLALLEKEQVHVSFSYIGQNVDAHPDLAMLALKAGHEIQNHTYTHPHLKTLDDAAVFQEVTKASPAIEHATGKPPAWFWGPFLELDERVIAQVKKSRPDALPLYSLSFYFHRRLERQGDRRCDHSQTRYHRYQG